ncbi:hypothetical protein [Aliarcobacter cryaerophilus]|uniref:Uncharacterized protein n=1 Tax=Aliarcobacter cryaerophilus TaxID=28198 RepID=A0AA46NTW4_9BACT|nr:hypothetical protein [Aliarcobacter cryaerophilus]UYF42493.1 hypothetical protein NGX11_06175 [Aliarcobacter cryaerophilus]
MLDSFKLNSIKILPKLIIVFVGFGLFFISDIYLKDNIQGLFINISATLISIPIVFIVYEIWQEKTHRKLNESVYSFAKNEMTQNLLKIKEQMKFFMEGAFVYFGNNDIVIDDEDIGNIKLTMREKNQIENIDEEEFENNEDDIYSFEKDTIVPLIYDNRYLYFQILDLDISYLVEDMEKVLNNSFIMERLDDEKTQIIVHLIEALKMLDSFINLHDDLFLKTDIKIDNMEIEKIDKNIYQLVYKEKDYKQILEIKEIFHKTKVYKLSKVYIINPDYCAIFGDLVHEVLDCIKNWIDSGESIFVDYATAKIGKL